MKFDYELWKYIWKENSFYILCLIFGFIEALMIIVLIIVIIIKFVC